MKNFPSKLALMFDSVKMIFFTFLLEQLLD